MFQKNIHWWWHKIIFGSIQLFLQLLCWQFLLAHSWISKFNKFPLFLLSKFWPRYIASSKLCEHDQQFQEFNHCFNHWVGDLRAKETTSSSLICWQWLSGIPVLSCLSTFWCLTNFVFLSPFVSTFNRNCYAICCSQIMTSSNT